MNEAPGVSREKLLSDVKAVMSDAEELLRSTASDAGEKVVELRTRLQDNLSHLRARVSEGESGLAEKTRAVTQSADQFVRDNPWKAIGIAAGAALVLGLLIGRR